ncbi:CNNM domain-containing protein [Nocardiopsis algeriensis]|uniref:CBS domain containing-hemolysin-like protein n=1 Tax=Nocardiopsis algeriensis TaxID=1478215 RepID=A0A841IPD4_9ACTN|nr:CNNM domain-containing protein [Nocardiopsis algeriensis]MBB6120050.1 CBS domain containing-hemolysin-like protein [Nocardiopsis algeriensis]
MTSTLLSIALGALVVFLITVLTGYFVAQEFGYMAVDRSRLRARAAAGDVGAKRALAITNRTSFMLSGAQLGITVTALLVGYVAEPMIGEGIGELLGVAGVPAGTGVAVGTVLALLFSTVVQMVFGELFPKNLAIARPEPVARRLALSTGIYMKVFGPVIWLFDQAAILLLKAVRIEPVEDVQHAATPRDLESIIAESKESGDLPAELSTLLDRTLDFHERTAGHAMIPRPEVTTVEEGDPVSRVVELMASGHSRFPVLGGGVDDIVGVICLRDVLALGDRDLSDTRVSEVARETVMVPVSLPLPVVLDHLREANEEFACVVDEYGGLAGVITTEDLAEELVGEIADEHTPEEESPVQMGGEASYYLVPGALHIDEVERLIDHDLPQGDYETLGGLVIHELHRLPEVGDRVDVALPRPASAHDSDPDMALTLVVGSVQRHVPHTVELRLRELAGEEAREVRA